MDSGKIYIYIKFGHYGVWWRNNIEQVLLNAKVSDMTVDVVRHLSFAEAEDFVLVKEGRLN